MRRPSPPLRITRALGALVVVVVLVIATGVWQVLETRRGIASQARAGNEVLARAAAAAVGADMETQVDRVRFMAARPELPALLASGDTDRLQQAADFVGVLYPDFVSASIIDSDGVVRAHWPNPDATVGDDLRGTQAFDEVVAARTPVVSAPTDLPGSVRGVYLTVGLRAQDGDVVGFLRLGYPVSRLQAIQADIGVSGGGSMMLLDGRGRALSGFADDDVVLTLPGADAARYGQGDLTLPDRDGVRIVGWAVVAGLDWIVVVEQPRGSALQGATAVASRMAIIVLLASLVAAFAAAFVGRLLRQVHRERNRSSAILSSIADGAITTDASGRIRTMNAAMSVLTGWRVEDAAGEHLTDVVVLLDAHDERVARADYMLTRAIACRAPMASRGFDLSVRSRDGTRTPVGITAAPILAQDGELIGGVAVYRDVSYERELDDMKSSLVSTVSHELRTPLTMIQGFSELLLERNVDAERRREAVEYINASAQRLARMIEDLLQVSHLDAGNVSIQMADVDLAKTLETSVAPFRSRHPSRIFTTHLAGLPAVAGDVNMIERVITNLLSNAVKYSPDGTRVEVRGRRDGSRVVVEVIDHGIGMTPEDATKLFGKFFRSSHPQVQREAGSGLGLYITRGLVRLQGGDIWASSEPGRGSTFSFSLPVPGAGEEEKTA